jgi:hypothetical protein
MEPSISQQIHDASIEISHQGDGSAAEKLNEVLNRFLGWPFMATTGFAVDAEGQTSEIFTTVVYVAPNHNPAQAPVEVSADALAAVIDSSEMLDLPGLNAAYARVAQAKNLKKKSIPEKNRMPRSATLGIVFATDSTLTVEELANELDRLNRQYPGGQWPDMVVVLSKGIVNYAVQFPGEATSGDFFLTAESVLDSFVPPMYIVMLMRATAEFTLNKMCGFLFGHLTLFSPGAKLPPWIEMLADTPKEGITLWGYQYSLKGELVAVPRHVYNDRYFPPPPLRIASQRGDVLSTIQFLPWQDGGVIVLKGKLPLEGLLVFFGKEALMRAGTVKRPDAQISYVLPITEINFREMLGRLQRQSNMLVKKDPTKWVVEKFADEGSSSPFMARLFMGNMRLRDVVFPVHAERQQFDKAYEFVIMTLLNTRETAQDIDKLWHGHVKRISLGEIARLNGQVLHIDEPIDRELRKQVEHFLNSAVRALKQGMPEVAKALHVNLGFFFQKQNAFLNGIQQLSKADPKLADYLSESRKWSERLLKSRNAIEHEGWVLPKAKYSHDSNGILVEEPQISGQPITKFIEFIIDRLSCFIEEVVAHSLQAHMPTGISITEIPLIKRDLEMPERFHLTLKTGGMAIWSLSYHDSVFEKT